VAWPSVQHSLNAPVAGLGLIVAFETIASFAPTVGTGFLVDRFGPNGLPVMACALAGISLVVFAVTPTWWWAILTWTIFGAAIGSLDPAINAELAINRDLRALGWLHASWGLGAAGGPALVGFSLVVFTSWRPAFAVMGLIWAAVALLTLAVRPYRGTGHATQTTVAPRASGRVRALVLIGAVLFFVDFGLELSAGQWPYTQLTESRGLPPLIAGWGASLYWLGLSAGRVGLGTVGHRVSATGLLTLGSLLAVTGTVAFWLLPASPAALIALPITGLGLSVIVPVVYKVVPDRVGPAIATRAAGYLASGGTVAGIVIPLLVGLAFQDLGPGSLGPVLVIMAIALVTAQFAFRRA
jgi:MFS family permease